MTAAPFPLITVEGGARARGRQYGQQARSRIETSLRIYNTAFDKVGLSWSEACVIARAFMPKIEEFRADYLEEIVGIAEGCGQQVEAIVALNARTEMLYWAHAKKQEEATPKDGCTGAVILPGASSSGQVLHGQNWDWRAECVDSAVVLRIRPDHGPSILTFCEAGILARAGLNSAGIALTGNFLRSDADFNRPGVPIPFVRRAILESPLLSDAIGAVYNAPRAFSNNMLLSDAGGEAISLEASPDEVFWVAPQDGILVHANHFLAGGAHAKLRDLSPLTTPDTLYRQQRLQALLRRDAGRLSREHLQSAFADRFGAPRAILRSPTPGPGGSTSATVASIVMEPAEGRMWVAPSPYEEIHYQEYALQT